MATELVRDRGSAGPRDHGFEDARPRGRWRRGCSLVGGGGADVACEGSVALGFSPTALLCLSLFRALVAASNLCWCSDKRAAIAVLTFVVWDGEGGLVGDFGFLGLLLSWLLSLGWEGAGAGGGVDGDVSRRCCSGFGMRLFSQSSSCIGV